MKKAEDMPPRFKQFWQSQNKEWPVKKHHKLTIHENMSDPWKQFLQSIHEAANKNWK
ncbi:hypothetical protein ACJ2A9_12105 [Anaerobacillus sp. MEB173]|uniref:hypothetical protein n=1 Tax=Anaerobacillus sp. MEB173 TaxID=3383345 RepID=UPI003F927FD9